MKISLYNDYLVFLRFIRFFVERISPYSFIQINNRML